MAGFDRWDSGPGPRPPAPAIDPNDFPPEVFRFLDDGQAVSAAPARASPKGGGALAADDKRKQTMFKLRYSHFSDKDNTLNSHLVADGPSRIDIARFPEEVQPLLREAVAGKHRASYVDMNDLVTIFSLYKEIVDHPDSIPISVLPRELHGKVEAFDVDGNGLISPDELAAAAELYQASQRKQRRYLVALVASFAFILVCLGTVGGLVYAVVEGTKETHTGSAGVTTSAANASSVAMYGTVDVRRVFAEKDAKRNQQFAEDLKNGRIPILASGTDYGKTPEAVQLYGLDAAGGGGPTGAYSFKLAAGAREDQVVALCKVVEQYGAACMNTGSASETAQVLVRGSRAQVESTRSRIQRDAGCLDPRFYPNPHMGCPNEYTVITIEELVNLEVPVHHVSEEVHLHDADAHRRRLAAIEHLILRTPQGRLHRQRKAPNATHGAGARRDLRYLAANGEPAMPAGEMPQESCYSASDAGASYRGGANAVRAPDAAGAMATFPCEPWDELRVKHAGTMFFSRSDGGDVDDGVLAGNACRAPPGSPFDRPWCFYKADDGSVKLHTCALPSCESEAYAASGDDRLFGLDDWSWGLERVQKADPPYQAYAPTAYRETLNGEGVHLFVFDTGVNFGHADLSGRMGTQRDFTADAGTDKENVDGNGHGTMVASIATGAAYGVAPGAKVHAYKIMSSTGSGSPEAFHSAVQALLDYHEGVLKPRNARAVAVMSMRGAKTNAANAMVQRLVEAGIPVAVAAGNDDDDACGFSPASATKAEASSAAAEHPVLTVAATRFDDTKSAFSNWGSCVSVWAPGSAVKAARFDRNNVFALYDGTSAAAPFVAGVLALVLEAMPGATAVEANNLVLGAALSGKVHALGAAHTFASGGGGGQADEAANIAATANKLLHIPSNLWGLPADGADAASNASASLPPCGASAYSQWQPWSGSACPPRGSTVCGSATADVRVGGGSTVRTVRRPFVTSHRTCRPTTDAATGAPTCACPTGTGVETRVESCAPDSDENYYRFPSTSCGTPAAVVTDPSTLVGTALTFQPSTDGMAFSTHRTVLARGCDGSPVLPFEGYASRHTKLVGMSDDAQRTVSLGGTFDIRGTKQDSANVMSNGYVTFGKGRVEYPYFRGANTTEMLARHFDPSGGATGLSGLWADLDPSAGGSIYVGTEPILDIFPEELSLGADAAPPRKVAVVTYAAVKAWGTSRPFESGGPSRETTFQMLFHLDGSGVMQVAYQSIAPTLANAAVVGVRNGAFDFARERSQGYEPYPFEDALPLPRASPFEPTRLFR